MQGGQERIASLGRAYYPACAVRRVPAAATDWPFLKSATWVFCASVKISAILGLNSFWRACNSFF